MEENPFTSCCSNEFMHTEIGDGVIYASNIFTPNNDGKNDFFFIFANQNSITEILSLKIFDINGAMVFETLNRPPNSPEIGWAGENVNGNIISGVYTFEVIALSTDGTEGTATGTICACVCDSEEGADCTLMEAAQNGDCIFNNQIQIGLASGFMPSDFKNTASGEGSCQ